MAKIWSSLFGSQPQERMPLNDLYQQVIKYQGLEYPITPGGHNAGENFEAIEEDFEGYVAQAYKGDGIVYACMVARMRLFSQIRFQWQKMRDGRPGDLFGNKELGLFEEPWPNGGSTSALLNRALQHADMGGTHYAVRETRSRGAAATSRIRVLRPDWVTTILTAPPDEAVECDIAGWIYKPGNTQDRSAWKFYVAGDDRFAMWAPTPDPQAMYRGMSWLTPVVREIMSDKAATKHKSKFFENAATPSFAMSFKETVTNDQFKDFIRTMKETHQGADNAYKPLFVGGGADITPLMYDLRQLDFKATQGAGETRIAAAARVHPVIVGLSEGMQGSSLNAGNFRAAKDAWADGEMRPMWESLCQAYRQLVRVPEGARLWYDDRDISFLREDIAEKAKVIAQEADIIQGLVMQGFTWESACQAVAEGGDWRLLKHTGLFSVQLQPPMPNGPPVKIVDPNGKPVKQPAAPTPAGGKAGKQQPATGPGAAGRPAIGQQRPGAKPPAQPKGSRDGDDASEEA
ncbi:phage portal protein [Streptomyces sp. S1]|uniref:phage portal protein n=1 Tax=Streptomyces sp. S1 TaxID=718288 RepID=UPI003D712D2A